MNDFAAVLAPRSDQINAQDLIGGDLTITITGVKVTPGTEQPVSISFEGNAKVWRPCKTTGRVLMAAWGADTSVYAGRQVQLYLDPKVKWGGLEVGGIRIRALSHIDEDLRIVLAESKQVRKPVTVKRLVQSTAQTSQPVARYNAASAIARAAKQAEAGTDAFRVWFNTDDGKDCRSTGALTADEMVKLRAIATAADAAATDPFGLPPLAADDPGYTATPADVEAQIARELAERDAALTGK